MPRYSFTVDIDAPREFVFDRFIDLERAPEWIEGMARVSDVSGPVDQAGTTYMVYFGSWAKSQTTVLAAERPRLHRTKFGNWFLRGENEAVFAETGDGTRMTQTFTTVA